MNGDVYKLTLPLSVPVTAKKKFYLNLNQYRNTHFHVLNKAKTYFTEYVKEQVMCLPILDTISIRYVFYPKTNRRCDLGNTCAVVDKFLCDALVTYGRLTDDSVAFIPSVSYHFGGVDTNHPRVDCYISKIFPLKEA